MLLPCFGIYTRLTGKALNGSACWCALSASLALASGVSTTSPSTPAAMRPALRSVTRRTLNSVFARDRNINFCRLRTFFRSSAFDAVKIRCRNRRTSSSTRRQSTACQSKGASSGPFTAPTMVGLASNLSSGSGASVISLLTGSPDRVSALSRPRTRPGIRPVIRNDRLEEAAILSRFPAAFRLPAFASRSSHSRRGIGSPHGRPTGPTRGRTQTGLPRSARTSCDRGGCPLYPEDSGAHPDGSPPRPAPAASQRQSLNPATTSHHARLRFTRHQQGFNHVHPSGLPLARATGVEPAALRLSPELRTPPLPAAHVRGGDRPSSTDLELPLNSFHRSPIR